MKSSALSHPKDDPILLIRKSRIDICDGNRDAGILLSYFEYWHNVKAAMVEKNIRANDVAERHGEPRSESENLLLQYHTAAEIEEQTMGLLKKSRIQAARKLLRDRGFLTEHTNPDDRFKWDRTLYFQLEVDNINKALIQLATKQVGE